MKAEVEIGVNLKEVLLSMVGKVAGCESGIYYEYAFKEIRKTVVDSIAEVVKKGGVR